MKLEIQHVGDSRVDLMDFFPTPEAGLFQLFGRIGNGKTYIATYMVLERLRMGRVVYVNWPIKWEGYSEKDSFPHLIWSLMGFRSKFFSFPKENLRYIEIDEHFVDTLEKLTDCDVFLDEGHVAFDSYEMAKMTMQKRKAILHTRHFDRSIFVISQRFEAIHVTIRDNVNAFYRCQKLFQFRSFIIFRRTEFDIKGGQIDVEHPLGVRIIFGSRRVFEAYNTRYLRGDMQDSQSVHYSVEKLGYMARLFALWRFLRRHKAKRRH